MLVLTRRANQSIMIGADIVVTVLEVRGDQVRIGIDAPRSISVHREEVFRELEAANRAAASPGVGALEGLTASAPRPNASRASARSLPGWPPTAGGPPG